MRLVESFVLVKPREGGIVLIERQGVKELRFVSKLFTDLVEELPEACGRLFGAHHRQENIIAKRLIPLETEVGDFELTQPVLCPKNACAGSQKKHYFTDSPSHEIFTKKPSHETLGSILALSVLNESSLREKPLRCQYSLSSSKKKSSSVGNRPNLLHAFVWLVAVFQFFEILENLKRSARPNSIVD